MNYIEFRCGQCNRLLGKIKGEAEVKCSRCNSLNVLTGSTTTVYREVTKQPAETSNRMMVKTLYAARS